MKRGALFIGSLAIVMILASLAVAKQPPVDVCHKGKKTIRVAAPAVAAHVGHGDMACACEVVADCAARGGELDAQTCACQVDSFACEPAGTCDTEYAFGCNGSPDDCACATDSAGNGVCVNVVSLCEDLAPCPNGQGDCPEGTVCAVASCCANFDPPDVCLPLCR